MNESNKPQHKFHIWKILKYLHLDGTNMRVEKCVVCGETKLVNL